MKHYIERKDYNKVITVKLVIPGGCNAHCVFCYLNGYSEKLINNKKLFIENFISSLDYIINAIGNKNPISLDITGNEPTLDKDFLIKVLTMLKDYDIQSRVSRVTMTTNGYNLYNIDSKYFEGVVNYINISIHDFNPDRRANIMKTKMKLNYRDITEKLSKVGITCSAIAVLHKPINNFKDWCDDFIKWCKINGFIALRLRCNVFWIKDNKFDEYMQMYLEDTDYTIINHENTTDSHWARLRRYDKFRLFFLHGVEDTSILTKGIEYIIADDGKCYCDYYKRVPIEKYEYEIGKIYDLSEENIKLK